jgi:glycosyltransferase involved in cell wall biosynthesis
MRVAIVHDWLVTYAGAERVLEQLLLLYPRADLFSVVDFLPSDQRDFIQNKPVKTTFIQKLPMARSKYRNYLPLMPVAIEQLDMSGYDLVISSSHAVAKGVITGPGQRHISYVHSPIRYAWDLQHQYLRESGLDKGIKGIATRWMLHKIRMWDQRTANGVDQFIANSYFVAERIWKSYRRKSEVIYPPVDVDAFNIIENKEDFYLTASRMVPYKKIGLIVEAFSQMPDKKLVVIGSGPDFRKIKRKAGPNVTLLGYQPFEVLRDYMQRARAFVFAAEEDFGIIPVEANACGTPVLAYGKGGTLETIHGLDSPTPTGMFFNEQTVASLIETIAYFERVGNDISAQDCRKNSLRFSTERFRIEIDKLINQQFIKRHNNSVKLNWDKGTGSLSQFG